MYVAEDCVRTTRFARRDSAPLVFLRPVLYRREAHWLARARDLLLYTGTRVRIQL